MSPDPQPEVPPTVPLPDLPPEPEPPLDPQG